MNQRWKHVIAALALIAFTLWFICDAIADDHRGAIAISVIGAFAAGFLVGVQCTVRKPLS